MIDRSTVFTYSHHTYRAISWIQKAFKNEYYSSNTNAIVFNDNKSEISLICRRYRNHKKN